MWYLLNIMPTVCPRYNAPRHNTDTVETRLIMISKRLAVKLVSYMYYLDIYINNTNTN